MATVRELARHLGCSAATVSRALRQDPRLTNETITRVGALAAELGFPRLRQGKLPGRLVLVLVRDPVGAATHQHREALAGLRRAARRARVAVAVVHHHLDNADTLAQAPHLGRALADPRLAGIAVCGGCPVAVAEVLRLRAPLVCLGHDVPVLGVDAVQADHQRSAEILVDHLVGLGHRRIGLVASVSDDPPNRDRIAGYRSGMWRHQLERDDQLIVRFAGDASDAATKHRVITASYNDVTAWVVARNDGGEAIIQTLESAQLRVPDQVSVVAFHRIGRLRDGRLPTVCPIDFERLGQEMLGSLMDRWQGRSGGRRLLLSCPLEVGDTTGPPPSARSP